eukprot:m.80585 g.80585  ORF g.80585 m.80585 type:complete len:58 (-) comp14213_c0_seq1:87-260(-)
MSVRLQRLAYDLFFLSPAVPDLSMPYNVIMITSTLLASIFSMLVTLASNLRLPATKV